MNEIIFEHLQLEKDNQVASDKFKADKLATLGTLVAALHKTCRQR